VSREGRGGKEGRRRKRRRRSLLTAVTGEARGERL
jgi:hypothetical protein